MKKITIRYILEREIVGIPGVISALRVITNIIEEAPKVDEYRTRSVRRDQMGLHLLGRSIWRDDYGVLLEADVIPLPKSLHKCGPLEHREDSSLNSLLFL